MNDPTHDETAEDVDPRRGRGREPKPGVLLVFSAGQPSSVALPLPSGELVLGRDVLADYGLVDKSASRRHLRAYRHQGQLLVEDLGSRNGTYVDGLRAQPHQPTPARHGAVVRLGQSLLVAQDDIGPGHRVGRDGDFVHGPRSTAALERVREAAHGDGHLLLQGESGTGKEHAARLFHEASGASGELIAVNCAAIPESLAERLLFGATEGAYSGATKASPGYVQAASRGTLFLDEVAELALPVQAKLLRVVETGEVFALGASRPERIAVRICGATHKDLRAETADHQFRHDLFFRIGRLVVHLPPLRERREEIPWLVHAATERAKAEVTLHATFVEACMLRHWPGNVRELLAEADRAVRAASHERRTVLHADDLDPDAGALRTRTSTASPADDRRALPADTAIEEALGEHRGNVSAAARALGVHRNQIRRWLAKRG